MDKGLTLEAEDRGKESVEALENRVSGCAVNGSLLFSFSTTQGLVAANPFCEGDESEMDDEDRSGASRSSNGCVVASG